MLREPERLESQLLAAARDRVGGRGVLIDIGQDANLHLTLPSTPRPKLSDRSGAYVAPRQVFEYRFGKLRREQGEDQAMGSSLLVSVQRLARIAHLDRHED